MLTSSNIRVWCLFVCFSILYIVPGFSQDKNRFEFDRIEDNSFLMEEAYNQEPGVIQHISGFQFMDAKNWIYTFTDEWPAGGQKHQLSATVPFLKQEVAGFGDILVNYRYQAIYKERIAFSPRFSLILPSGNYRKGLGEGVTGYQINLPVSYLVSPEFVTHYNLGLTITPNAKHPDGSRFTQTIINYGFSIIDFFRTNFNLMLEVVGGTTFIKERGSKVSISNSVILNPGARYAINFKSGLQIVPGIAVPIGLDSMNGEVGLFAYLSFEHPLWHPKSGK